MRFKHCLKTKLLRRRNGEVVLMWNGLNNDTCEHCYQSAYTKIKRMEVERVTITKTDLVIEALLLQGLVCGTVCR